MKARIEAATAVLAGKALWACGRAADMATFQFGRRREILDFFSRDTQVGEYALHVQCPWRITREDQVVVGSQDLYYPAGHQNGSVQMPQDFDWDREPNRRDELLRLLFADGTRQFEVQRVQAFGAGGLRIALVDNMSLEVFPDDSLAHEHWRLLRPGVDEPHFVVTGSGVK